MRWCVGSVGCVLAFFAANLYAGTVAGVTIPDSLPPAISGDRTISGVEFCGGVGGTGTLTMSDADTLIVVGDADFTNMKLSDPAKGTIVIAAVRRDSTISKPVVKLTVSRTVLNNLIFDGFNNTTTMDLSLSIVGDSLTVNGDMIRRNVYRTSYIGATGATLDLTVKGDFSFTGADRVRFYAGNNKFYGDVSLITWFAYWGVGTATFEFAGSDTQNVSLEKSNFAMTSGEAYNTVRHSGPGMLRVMGSGFRCKKFVQDSGVLDLNGTKLAADTLIMRGALANVVNYSLTEKITDIDTSIVKIDSTRDSAVADTPWVFDTTLQYDTTKGFDTVWNQNNATLYAFRAGSFAGTPTDSVVVSPVKPWTIQSYGGLVATYSRIGNCTVTGSAGARGIAYNSTDAGGNTGWVFNAAGPTFSQSLPSTDTVYTGREIKFAVSPVSADTVSTLPVEWTINDTVQSASGYELVYKAAAAVTDNGLVVRAYLKQGDTRVDSTGPLTLVVLDSPRFKSSKLTGKTSGVIGKDTLRLTAGIDAGVDSILWYVVTSQNNTTTYTPVAMKTDTVWTSGDLGSTLHVLATDKSQHNMTFAAVGIDTSSPPLPPDTASAKVSVYLPITIVANVIDAKIDSLGMSARFSIVAQSEAAMKFQWFTRTGTKNTAIAGATDSVLIVPNVTDSMLTLQYLCEISYDGTKYTSAKGKIVVEPIVAVRLERAAPATFGFRTAYPNPFRSATTLQFAVPTRTRVTLSVYDMDGRLVSRLIDHLFDTGYYAARWQGCSATGERAAPGQYLVRMHARGFAREQRVVLVR